MSEDMVDGGSGLDRRDFIKRGAILGGMVWAAPAVSTLGARAFAQEENGSPEIVFNCPPANRLRFKWERVGNGGVFVRCGDGGDCVDPVYSEVTGCVVTADQTTATNPAIVALSATRELRATLSADRKSVTFSIHIVSATNPRRAEIVAASVKGGSLNNERGYCEPGRVSSDRKSVVVSAPGSDRPDVSNVTGVVCINPEATA